MIDVALLEEKLVPGKPLGRHVEHDSRSRDFPVDVDEAAPLVEVLWPRYGNPFNQGNVGSCTGNAITGVLNTRPFHSASGKLHTEKDAVAIYSAATRIDNIEGEYPPTDSGSSGLAVCKVAKSEGLIAGYKHAFTIAAALQALMKGPVVTGVAWFAGFDTPDENGLVEISGEIRGGHEFEIRGYDPATDLLTAENSWGLDWGLRGLFHFTSRTWAELLKQQGDVTVPTPLA